MDGDADCEGEWRLIREEAHEAPSAMAHDAVAAETAAADGLRTVRLYRWCPSALSLGYRQSPETVDWDFCEREGIDVVRRPTGGGGIYHDAVGDLSYSVIVPADAVSGDLMESYATLCEPLFDAFERLGVDARFSDVKRPALYEPACYLRELHPAHDIVAPDGRKLSGNAQHRTREAVVQHGSITVHATPARHLACFDDPPVTPAEFHERVSGIDDHVDVTRETVVEAFEAALADWAGATDGAWTDAERDRAAEIVDRTFASDAWTRERQDPADRDESESGGAP